MVASSDEDEVPTAASREDVILSSFQRDLIPGWQIVPA